MEDYEALLTAAGVPECKRAILQKGIWLCFNADVLGAIKEKMDKSLSSASPFEGVEQYEYYLLMGKVFSQLEEQRIHSKANRPTSLLPKFGAVNAMLAGVAVCVLSAVLRMSSSIANAASVVVWGFLGNLFADMYKSVQKEKDLSKIKISKYFPPLLKIIGLGFLWFIVNISSSELSRKFLCNHRHQLPIKPELVDKYFSLFHNQTLLCKSVVQLEEVKNITLEIRQDIADVTKVISAQVKEHCNSSVDLGKVIEDQLKLMGEKSEESLTNLRNTFTSCTTSLESLDIVKRKLEDDLSSCKSAYTHRSQPSMNDRCETGLKHCEEKRDEYYMDFSRCVNRSNLLSQENSELKEKKESYRLKWLKKNDDLQSCENELKMSQNQVSKFSNSYWVKHGDDGDQSQ
eukprot:TRINITY_DN25360_c0_g1_i2.p1 TRINITY_DN25360_c0_g1~~TRINITY_DN25360_c0_g1_i2.p1  ORF type:complete len:402 (-),score=103.12 TRINITY_DN25360_c0_g1_i2:137-1342(-)